MVGSQQYTIPQKYRTCTPPQAEEETETKCVNFRDRIVNNPCKWQANEYVPKILNLMRPRRYKPREIKSFSMKEKTSCVNIIPTFCEFVEYVVRNPSKQDAHWKPMSKVFQQIKLSKSTSILQMSNHNSNVLHACWIIMQ